MRNRALRFREGGYACFQKENLFPCIHFVWGFVSELRNDRREEQKLFLEKKILCNSEILKRNTWRIPQHWRQAQLFGRFVGITLVSSR